MKTLTTKSTNCPQVTKNIQKCNPNLNRVATKWEKKFPEFSRLFQSHKLTFPQVIATKSNPTISNYQ